MISFLLALHVAAGAAASLVMILPLVSAKGGQLHRRAGWLFTGGMATVCASALSLSGIRLLADQAASARSFSLLLVYIAILTSAFLWAGVQVVRHKHRTTPGTWGDAGHAVLLAGAGALACAYGLRTNQPLFMVFGAVGVSNGVSGISYWRRAPSHMDWWLAHMANMLSACITATTAFLLAGARHFGLPGDAIVLWLGPTVVGVPLIAIWVRYYARRFSVAAPPHRPAAAVSHAS